MRLPCYIVLLALKSISFRKHRFTSKSPSTAKRMWCTKSCEPNNQRMSIHRLSALCRSPRAQNFHLLHTIETSTRDCFPRGERLPGYTVVLALKSISFRKHRFTSNSPSSAKRMWCTKSCEPNNQRMSIHRLSALCRSPRAQNFHLLHTIETSTRDCSPLEERLPGYTVLLAP